MKLPASAVRYLLITFLFSWSLWLLALWTRGSALHLYWFGSRFDLPFFDMLTWLGAFGPGIVALFMTGEGESGDSLWARLANWRVGQMWYSIAFFLPFCIVLVAILAYAATGGKAYMASPSEYWMLFALLHLFLAPLFEELGWRGHLLPMLLEGRSALQASLVLGGAWGLWHLPLRWSQHPGDSYDFFVFFLVYCVLVAGLSVIFTWFFLRTRGAIFPVVLLHAAYNAMVVFVMLPTSAAEGWSCVLWLTATVWVAAVLVYRLGGLRLMSSSGISRA